MTYKNCNKTTRKQYCVIFKVISRILLPSVNHTRPVSKQEILKTSIGEDKPHQKPLPYCIKSSLSVPTLWMGTFIMPSQEAARVWLSFRAMVWGTPPGNMFPENMFHGPMAEQVRAFLAATKQLYEWFSPSVRPSVRLSVRPSVTPFWLCSHHPIIMKFSGVITSDKSDVHAKGQGQRSKVKVTEVTTQLNRFRTVTPVWIHIWWWDDAYSLIMLRRGALLFFKVIRQISRSHGSKKRRIWPRLGVSGL